MIFEIINPSDKAYITSDNFEVACVAVCVLGNGHYGLHEVDGEKRMPPFLFRHPDEFFKDNFGKTFEESLKSTDKAKISAALKTVHLDGERTSLNNIVKTARAYAKALLV
jgi:hypothetical protein